MDEGTFQKEMGGGGSGKLDLHSETPFILMRSNEGDNAMTNSDISLLRIVERFQKKKKKKVEKSLLLYSDWIGVQYRPRFSVHTQIRLLKAATHIAR